VTDHSEPARGLVLIIGVGNDLRGDDGAGPAVIDAVERHDLSGVRTVWAHQLLPELAEQIAVAERVIFVDAEIAGAASAGGAVAGDPVATGVAADTGAAAIRTESGVRVTPLVAGQPEIGGHQADPGALLGLVKLAGLPVPEAVLITVPAYDLSLATGLSPATRVAVDAAVALVLELCSSWLASPQPSDATPH
jgi:hypothetical protein